MMLDQRIVNEVVAAALREDAPWGDITSEYLIPEGATATANLVAREPGVFAGAAAFEASFSLTDPRVRVAWMIAEGARFAAGEVLAQVSGLARGILTGERIGLNFAQRMSGIATMTADFVELVAGTNAVIADTRKTTPGLRAFERHAVMCGGGHNHRFSLSDAVMAKDNHLAVLTAGGKDLTTELARVRSELPHTMKLEVEVDRLEQIEPVLAAGIDVIMLDNFSLADLATGVAQVAGRAIVEASGGVNRENVRSIAETGVDVISIGALTHSARALDLGLDITIDAGR